MGVTVKLIGYGVIAGAVWLWIEQPFFVAVAVALLAGALVGYGWRSTMQTCEACGGRFPALDDARHIHEAAVVRVNDPAESRLVGLGFRADEVRPLLAKARANGETDPSGYVMRSLIR